MKRFRSTLSIGLALLVLFASSSFSVGLHICSGAIQNIALFGKAEGCEKEKQLPPCHRHETPACCQDEMVVHDSDEFQANGAQIDVSPLTVAYLIADHIILDEIVSSATVVSPRYYNYDPPLRSCDLTVEHQVFLI